MKGREKFFFFEKSVWQQKKRKSNNEEGGQREREHLEGTYKGVETWKESTDRKRNEKHKYKNEDDQNGNLNREIFLLARNTKNEIQMSGEKGICFRKCWKQWEWDKRNEIFCWKRSKQKENGKNETSINKHIFEEKREMNTRREKQEDTQKEK